MGDTDSETVLNIYLEGIKTSLRVIPGERFLPGLCRRVGTGALIVTPAAADLQRELAAGIAMGGVSVFLVTRYLSENDECTEG